MSAHGWPVAAFPLSLLNITMLRRVPFQGHAGRYISRVPGQPHCAGVPIYSFAAGGLSNCTDVLTQGMGVTRRAMHRPAGVLTPASPVTGQIERP
ncbi:MAG: hypothetical protein AAFO79_10550, partial [Pseudomonadota bacterium]